MVFLRSVALFVLSEFLSLLYDSGLLLSVFV